MTRSEQTQLVGSRLTMTPARTAQVGKAETPARKSGISESGIIAEGLEHNIATNFYTTLLTHFP
jgi:hypothetical protein